LGAKWLHFVNLCYYLYLSILARQRKGKEFAHTTSSYISFYKTGHKTTFSCKGPWECASLRVFMCSTNTQAPIMKRNIENGYGGVTSKTGQPLDWRIPSTEI
jgi:hypothetical protein